MKKSFVLHLDSLSVIEKMTDEQVGKLLRKMKSYHNGNEYYPDDILIDIAFEQFKNQFDRDKIKFKNVCERNKANGLKGGRPKTKSNPENPSGYSGNQKKPRKAESDNDNDNDNDSDNDNIITITKSNKDKSLVGYGKPDINNVIKTIKESVEANGLMYKAGKQERNRANNILTGKDFGECARKNNMTRGEFAQNIIKISTGDEFWAGKIFNCETLYKHYAQVFNNAKRVYENKQKEGPGAITI